MILFKNHLFGLALGYALVATLGSAALGSAALGSATLGSATLRSTSAILSGGQLKIGSGGWKFRIGNKGFRVQFASQRLTAALLLLVCFCCLAKNFFGVHARVVLSKLGQMEHPCTFCHFD